MGGRSGCLLRQARREGGQGGFWSGVRALGRVTAPSFPQMHDGNNEISPTCPAPLAPWLLPFMLVGRWWAGGLLFAESLPHARRCATSQTDLPTLQIVPVRKPRPGQIVPPHLAPLLTLKGCEVLRQPAEGAQGRPCLENWEPLSCGLLTALGAR